MGCDASVPPIDPIGIDRRWRNIRTSSATVPPVQIQHITQTIVLRVAFSSENGERNIAFNAYFRSARVPCPFMGRTSSPPQTWDFAVICAHVGAHAMLHSDIACAPAPGARLRAFRPENQGKCRTRQFPLDNSRILRIQSVYTVIATPPDTSRNSRKAAGQRNGITRCAHQRKHTYSPLSTRRNHPVPYPQASQGRDSFAGFTACHFSIFRIGSAYSAPGPPFFGHCATALTSPFRTV